MKFFRYQGVDKLPLTHQLISNMKKNDQYVNKLPLTLLMFIEIDISLSHMLLCDSIYIIRK